MDNINFRSTVGAYSGPARPKLPNSTRNQKFCKQRFSGRPSVSNFRTVAASAINRSRNFVANIMRNATGDQHVLSATEANLNTPETQPIPLLQPKPVRRPFIQETFRSGVPIQTPDFVRLFSPIDIEFDLYGNVSRNTLGEPIDISFSRTSTRIGSLSLEQAIQREIITLDIKSIVNLWKVKMLNIANNHFPKFVTGYNIINFNNHLPNNGRVVIHNGRIIPILTEQMEQVRNLYSLMFTGLILTILRTKKPNFFTKKPYQVQKEFKSILSNDLPNKNDFLYSLVYELPVDFQLSRTLTHKINLRIVFNIFRMKLEGNQEQTKINLATCFITGNDEEIKCPLWANAMDTIDPTKINLNDEKEKFEWLKQHLQPNGFLEALKSIYQNFETNLEFQNEIKQDLESLGVDPYIVEEIFQGKITWPHA